MDASKHTWYEGLHILKPKLAHSRRITSSKDVPRGVSPYVKKMEASLQILGKYTMSFTQHTPDVSKAVPTLVKNSNFFFCTDSKDNQEIY